MDVSMKAAFWILPLCGLACGNSDRIITTDTSESISVSEMSLSTQLLIAVINSDLEQMTQVLDQGAKANDAIQVAVAGANPDVVELLLDRGAVPDEDTVLRAVAASTQFPETGPEVVRMLLQHGAKADWRSLFGAILLRHD